MDALKQVALYILENIDDDDRVVLAPCHKNKNETCRCFPVDAEFWTIYIGHMALEDIVSAEASVALLMTLWDERHFDIDFDFGEDGYSASNIADALKQTELLATAHPGSEQAKAKISKDLAPLREALTRANSNHGKIGIIAQMQTRADILCFPDRVDYGEPPSLDTPFTTLSDAGDTLVAAWMPEHPQRLLLGVRSWDTGTSRLLSRNEAKALAEAIKSRTSFSLDETEVQVDIQATSANRGEPYRDGMEIKVGDHSIFLEEGYDCETLAELVKPA
jgi:hypothetical protein